MGDSASTIPAIKKSLCRVASKDREFAKLLDPTSEMEHRELRVASMITVADQIKGSEA
jgi:murein endopeptidase